MQCVSELNYRVWGQSGSGMKMPRFQSDMVLRVLAVIERTCDGAPVEILEGPISI